MGTINLMSYVIKLWNNDLACELTKLNIKDGYEH